MAASRYPEAPYSTPQAPYPYARHHKPPTPADHTPPTLARHKLPAHTLDLVGLGGLWCRVRGFPLPSTLDTRSPSLDTISPFPQLSKPELDGKFRLVCMVWVCREDWGL